MSLTVLGGLFVYNSVFQSFSCRGTLHKREGHSRNPTN